MEADIVPLPRKQDLNTRISVKFFRYKGLVKRYWWVLLLTVSCGLTWQAWNLYSKPVLYSSEGTLAVNDQPNDPNSPAVRDEEDDFYGTQLHIMADPEIATMATHWVDLNHPDLTALACPVTVTPTQDPRTSLFTVTGIGTNGRYTQAYVQGVMESTIDFKSEKLNNLNNKAEGAYGAELTRLETDRDKREKALQDFVKANNMADWENIGSTAAKYLADLKTRQAGLQTELDRLQNLTDKELLTNPESSIDGSGKGGVGNPLTAQYTQVSQVLAQKQAEIAQRSLVWKPAHPRLIALKEDIANTQAQLTTIEQQNHELSQVRISAIQKELAVLNANIDQYNQKALAAGAKTDEYQRLKDDLTRSSSLYEKLLGQMTVLDTEKKVTPGLLSVLKNASFAKLVDPGTAKHLTIGFILGLALGILFLAIMDRTDDRVASSTEVMEHFNEPIMGQIPNVEASRTLAGLPLLTEEDERYTFAESLRSLRSSLMFMPNQGALKSLLVTSSIPGEGKSTIASNLGITMALAGTRVLLVDADLRRGDLASIFNLDGRFGLSSILRDEMPWRSVAKATPYPGLTLIPRGPVTNQSSELLLVPRFDELMKEWKSEFDLVLFNTSPILATDDTASIAPNFDGALMVVRAGYTSARLVRNSLNAMYQRRVNILGLILNSVDTEMPDYYYYRYPKYYAA